MFKLFSFAAFVKRSFLGIQFIAGSVRCSRHLISSRLSRGPAIFNKGFTLKFCKRSELCLSIAEYIERASPTTFLSCSNTSELKYQFRTVKVPVLAHRFLLFSKCLMECQYSK